MTYKEVLSAIAIALTFIAFFPYIRSIITGKTKPHVFSWIIWGSTTFIVFFALFAARNFIVILALESYSVTTVLFPAVIATACIALMAMVVYRRQALPK